MGILIKLTLQLTLILLTICFFAWLCSDKFFMNSCVYGEQGDYEAVKTKLIGDLQKKNLETYQRNKEGL